MEFKIYRKKIEEDRIVFVLVNRKIGEKKWLEEKSFDDIQTLTWYFQGAVGSYA